jgi:DNA (cytosine-5)-methyltransferase 1
MSRLISPVAGKGKGMSDTSTRSGMLWEVERILQECKDLGELPQILLMENVPQVKSNDPRAWEKWLSRLEELGYKNYHKDLIATDYGIPQTRNRTFMVSILGDYNYTFPKPISLKLKLKDMLEENVDKKYYLSDAMLNYLHSESSGGFSRKESFERIQDKIEKSGIAATITTNAGQRATDNYIKIKNATKKGYLEATDGDGIDISSRMEHHRGNVQKEKIQTITTSGGNDREVVINSNIKNINYENKTFNTLGTNCGSSTSAGGGVVVNSDLRIRKLTPRECFRLMGVKDEDFDKVAKNQSDSSLFHLAGDSIVTNVLQAIFKELF